MFITSKEAMKIPFNKPFLTGKELEYIKIAVDSGKISGNGFFTQKCQNFFEKKYGFQKTLLTTSCTDALEMSALLCEVGPDDEVIVPSYTFVSTANPFVLRGAKIIFADSTTENPNIDPEEIKKLITPKTKVIVVVHYAGISCNLEPIVELCKNNNIFLVEDAAQAIDSYYYSTPLGTFGDLATFSFHETKNIISGEGGLLVINNPNLFKRAEILWEKGTNRSAFFKGEVDKYGWVDIGSSFLPSEVTAAFLYAQLENLEIIQTKRKQIWQNYYNNLIEFNGDAIHLPIIPKYASNNAHMFYLVWSSGDSRDQYIQYMKKRSIMPVFHYISLHKSPYYISKHGERVLKNSDFYTNHLVRLPFYYELSIEEQNEILTETKKFIMKLSMKSN